MNQQFFDAASLVRAEYLYREYAKSNTYALPWESLDSTGRLPWLMKALTEDLNTTHQAHSQSKPLPSFDAGEEIARLNPDLTFTGKSEKKRVG